MGMHLGLAERRPGSITIARSILLFCRNSRRTLPHISIDRSPLVPGLSPVEIHYREWGDGAPLVFLHGGWGYQVYPFDRQIEAFGDRFRIIAPDRSGYGRSPRIR